jgi:hypothetical protein
LIRKLAAATLVTLSLAFVPTGAGVAQQPSVLDLGYCIIDGYDKALCLSLAEEGKLAKMPVQGRRDAGMTPADDAHAVRVGQCVLEGKHPPEWCGAH